jgi:hypothetical protein
LSIPPIDSSLMYDIFDLESFSQPHDPQSQRDQSSSKHSFYKQAKIIILEIGVKYDLLKKGGK